MNPLFSYYKHTSTKIVQFSDIENNFIYVLKVKIHFVKVEVGQSYS